MTIYYNEVFTFGGETIYAKTMTPNKVPGTVKQVIGKQIIKHSTPGRNMYDWELTISGVIYLDKEANRIALEAFWDGVKHAFVDGKHDGNYLVETLTFNDSGSNPTSYDYTLQLTQVQQ